MNPQDPTQRMREILVDYSEWRSMNEAGVDLNLESKMTEALTELSKLMDEAKLDELKYLRHVADTSRQPYYIPYVEVENRIAALQAKPTESEDTIRKEAS